MRSDALLELRSGVMRPASRQPKQGVGGQEPSWEEVRTRDCAGPHAYRMRARAGRYVCASIRTRHPRRRCCMYGQATLMRVLDACGLGRKVVRA